MRRAGRNSPFTLAVLGLGFVFLYAPILSLVIYSFNESRLVMIWSGFSLKWYGELLADRQLMDAVWVSLRVAFQTAWSAVAIGTMAAMLLVRFRHFRGKTLFGAMITAPLVTPEVITGLSLEEAAMDLGANRLKVLFVITLPLILPALAAGWLLAFTLSLDDLVIASFVSGPVSTTLPMKVFSSVRMGVSPKINALATLWIAAVSLAAIVAWRVVATGRRRHRRELRAAR